jgi:hypothetical protein
VLRNSPGSLAILAAIRRAFIHRTRTHDALRHYVNFTEVNGFCRVTSRRVQCHKRIVETGKN